MKNIVLVGAGNVATHLGLALIASGYNVIQVYSRTEEPARKLADKLSATITTDINNISGDADIYIIAVKDKAIEDITNQINISDKLIVHTSGSISIDILKNASGNYGVLYPLQTFSKNTEINFKTVPLCIEANTRLNENKLFSLARDISDNVHLITTKQRKSLHIAAVIACNFSNHMYFIAEDILKKENLAFDMLKPLIMETASKIEDNSPGDIQTGPAIREDQKIMDNHLEYLSCSPTYRDLYKMISKSIIEIK